MLPTAKHIKKYNDWELYTTTRGFMTSTEIYGECQIEVQTQRSKRAKSFLLHNLKSSLLQLYATDYSMTLNENFGKLFIGRIPHTIMTLFSFRARKRVTKSKVSQTCHFRPFEITYIRDLYVTDYC